MRLWGYEVLRFWGYGVLGLWGFEVFSYLVGSLLIFGYGVLQMFAYGIFVLHQIGEGAKHSSFGKVLAVDNQLFVESQVLCNASRLDGVAQCNGGHTLGICGDDGVSAGSDEHPALGDGMANLTIVEVVDVENV